MYTAAALATLSFLSGVHSQLVGTLTPETHLSLSTSKCTAAGCTTQADKIVIDANWRWLHATANYTNCYTGNTWSSTLCPTSAACTANCALDGAKYSESYGITSTGTGLRLNFVTVSTDATNIGSRTYLMDTDTTYRMFKLKNQEFTFDVDMSKLPCGLNGALYFVAMDADGGMSKYPTNKAGAKYGTGYCDAQCPRDLKYINGVANVAGWTGSSNDANAGTGNFGSCCSEMDIWEANSMAAAYTPHPCSSIGQTQCTGSTCTRNTGLCDADGCDFNSYRMGNTSFLGVGKTIDTSKVFTVVTQFITADGTATGALTEIRRSYVQNGVVYGNSVSNVANVPGNSISDSFCAAQKTAFGDTNYFANKGGMKQMGAAMDVGMVLVMSIWDDHSADMLWLDSNYPLTKDPSTPGVARGACDAASGVPATVEKAHPDAYVIYSNIKVGDIGSTFKAGTSTPANPTTTATTPGATSGTGTVAKYGQCGGQGYTGPTTCVASTCTYSNAWYSQCL